MLLPRKITTKAVADIFGDLLEIRSPEPEARVLIIMTGGTICMRNSPAGLVPARGFLDQCLTSRPEFNDGGDPGLVDVRVDDDSPAQKYKSLRTPSSKYGKQIRYASETFHCPICLSVGQCARLLVF